MSFVQPRFKELCPCGDPRCHATGAPLKTTGHSRGCHDACPVCANPKSKAGRRIPQAVRRKVVLRSQDRCEFVHNGHRCEHMAEHMHHKRRRSQGGGDTDTNLVHLCHDHHEFVHREPEWAAAHGLLILSRDPLSSAVTKVIPK